MQRLTSNAAATTSQPNWAVLLPAARGRSLTSARWCPSVRPCPRQGGTRWVCVTARRLAGTHAVLLLQPLAAL